MKTFVSALTGLVLILSMAACNQDGQFSADPTKGGAPLDIIQLKRGEYLAHICGFDAGKAQAILSTADGAADIAAWSFEEFKTAAHKGTIQDPAASYIRLPELPWAGFARMTDNDLRAVHVYLKSLTPEKSGRQAMIGKAN